MTHERSRRVRGMPIATDVAGSRLIAALIVALTLSFSVAISIAAAAGRMDQQRSVEALIADSLRADHNRSGPSDDQYYLDGRWRSGDDSYWPTTIGPATAAAVLYRQTRAPWLAEVSEATLNRAIASYRQADGSFGETSKGNDIETMTFASELGRSYLSLGNALKPAMRTAWLDAFRGAADFLIANGNLAWYTNGNIVLGNAEIMALAYRVTGEQRYRRAYLRAFEFAIAPPQERWPGFGLHLTRSPTRADGADGAGYLAEKGSAGATPGFDPEYAQLQLDVASRIYLLMRDARSLRLTNELTNALLPRVDRRTWSLDTSGGTRHHEAGRKVPFTTPALSVLAWQGGRKGFGRLAKSQFVVVDREYRGALTFSHQNFYRGLGDQVAPILEAASDHHGGPARSTR
jgi:hypothetical protein